MPSLKALIFDVDGTLADTERAHLAAFNHAFANFTGALRVLPDLAGTTVRKLATWFHGAATQAGAIA